MRSVTAEGKRIKCDHCEELFDLPEPQEEKLTGNRIGYYFKCPHCDHKYPFATITKEGLRLSRRLRKLREQGLGHTKRYRELLQRYQSYVEGPYEEGEVLNE